MSNWFDTEYLIRQQQMELNRKAREAWKFKHDRVSLRVRLFLGKKRRYQAAKNKTRTSN
ncbi:hypothetical protein [Paenibacillus solani]|uniref:hypothetical protein n=1 Tax=Paenibacillus solani TaxID=1705565 RepID=UPI003D2B63E1